MRLTFQYLAYIGVIGMGFTGWWAFNNEQLWTVSALVTVPHILDLAFGSLKGGE